GAHRVVIELGEDEVRVEPVDVHVEEEDLVALEIDEELAEAVGPDLARQGLERADVRHLVHVDPRLGGVSARGEREGEEDGDTAHAVSLSSVTAMKVLLIRHTHAVDGDEALDDEARWLTAKGRTLARAVGARLRDDEIVPDAIVTSPLVRAVQTAELVARGLKF